MNEDSEKLLNAVIHQAIIAGYLDKEIENYGLLKVTKEGLAFLKRPKSFKIVEDREYTEDDEEIANIKHLISYVNFCFGPHHLILCLNTLTGHFSLRQSNL